MRVPSTKGVTLAVHDLGGDGDPFLICHATGFHARAYEALAQALRPWHHVWGVDVRAHGDSTAPADGDFSWLGSRDDVLAAVDAIGATQVHGFGHSMGGAALMLAGAARPGLLASAFLYEPILYPDALPRQSTGNALAEGARRRKEVFPSKADALWHYARRTPLAALQARSLAAYVEYGFDDLDDGTVRLKCRAEHEARTFDHGGSIHVSAVVSVTARVTVALGEAEAGLGPALWAPAVAAALPNAALIAYPHLGHLGPLQDPATVADSILRVSAPEARDD